MNLVEIVGLLDSELQQLLKIKHTAAYINNIDTNAIKTKKSELFGLMVKLNGISNCDAKDIALHKCKKSPLFIE